MNKLLFSILFLSFFVSVEAQWSQLNDIPFVTHHSNAFGIDGKGYIVQGAPGSGQSQNMMWEYDPQNDSWSPLGLIPAPSRGFSIGDDMDGKYYFGFGIGLKDVWEFDPATNTYTELPECPCEPRWHPAFVAHQGKIYMGAGSSDNGDLRDWWVYDFATEEWTQKTNIPGNRRHHTFQFGIDDAIYVGGGHQENWSRYDIVTEEWTGINSMPEGRVAGTQFSYGGRGFTLSGDRRDHDPLDDRQFLMYEPDLDEWYNLPFEETMHRWAPTSFILDNSLYYFGGLGAFGDDSRMWKFDLSFTNCLAPLNPFAPSTTENSANLLWEMSPDGATDTVQWREKGAAEWNTEINITPNYVLEGLEACTEYEFRVNTSCDSGNSSFSSIADFKTIGCGSCVDFDFCDVSEDFRAFNVHIERVRIKDFDNQTGGTSFQGYSSYLSSDQVEIQPGEFFELEIEPAFLGNLKRGSCKAWIDFNGDGNFGNDEVIVDEFGFDSILLQTIEMPLDVAKGLVRMRIMMELSPLTGACQGTALGDGEVEDYCITILPTSTNINETGRPGYNSLRVFPNPNNGIFNLEYSKGERFEIFDFSGRLVSRGDLAPAFAEKSVKEIRTKDLTPGLYLIKVIGEDEVDSVSFLKE